MIQTKEILKQLWSDMYKLLWKCFKRFCPKMMNIFLKKFAIQLKWWLFFDKYLPNSNPFFLKRLKKHKLCKFSYQLNQLLLKKLIFISCISRVCFTMNNRQQNNGEGVISLRSAGDISLPRDASQRKSAASTMRGLIVPQGHNNPPTIIPLRHSRTSRESGDYASSDIQVSSKKQEKKREANRSASVLYLLEKKESII